MPRPTFLSLYASAARAWPTLLGLAAISCADLLGEYSVSTTVEPDQERRPLEPDASYDAQDELAPTEPAVGGCFPEEVRCSGRALQQCSGDRRRWELVAPCDSARHCDAALQVCTLQACSVGTFSCNEGALLACTRSGWEMVRQCDNQALCSQALRGCDRMGGCSSPPPCGQPSCDAGEVLCVEATLQVCNATRSGLEVLDRCINASLCDSSAGACLPAACEAGELQCSDNNVLLRCNPTRTGFTTAEVCTFGAVCSDAPGNERCVPPSCQPQTFSCSGTRLQRCSPEGDALLTVEVCDTPELCNAAAGRCDLNTSSQPDAG